MKKRCGNYSIALHVSLDGRHARFFIFYLAKTVFPIHVVKKQCIKNTMYPQMYVQHFRRHVFSLALYARARHGTG